MGDPQIAQGKYLVQGVAMCAHCHGPDLQGAPMGMKPAKPMKKWADKAPGIAGLPGWSVPAAVKFFTTAKGPDGKPADPPMPAYKLKSSDAQAVTAYLKSLKATKASHAGHEGHHH